jgi:hypothetical protein
VDDFRAQWILKLWTAHTFLKESPAFGFCTSRSLSFEKKDRLVADETRTLYRIAPDDDPLSG